MALQYTTVWDDFIHALHCMQADTGITFPYNPSIEGMYSISRLAEQRLGSDQYALLFERWSDSVRAIALCKKGELSLSGDSFDYAKKRILDLSGEARQLAYIGFYPKIAYYQYRTGQFQAAEESLARTMAIDDLLQDTYHALHGQKIHLTQNMSRMFAFLRKDDAAADMLLNILRYLITPRCYPHSTGQWGTTYLRRYENIENIPTTFALMSISFCNDCFRFPAYEISFIKRSQLLINGLRKVVNQSEIYNSMLDWILIKRSLYVQKRVDHYIQLSTAFITNYSEHYNDFKLLLIWDAIRIAKMLNFKSEKDIIEDFVGKFYKISFHKEQ